MATKFTLWIEGYSFSGETPVRASCLGEYEGDTFLDACNAWAQQTWHTDDYESQPHPAHWGRRIYDNEADARKHFG